METVKTRNLSVAEYFLQLQKEYLLADFRRKIYYSPKDKAYYEKLMGYKKEKIVKIAKRNRLKSIFSDKRTMKSIKAELFSDDGHPIFELNTFDKQNYYSVGSEFSYMGEIWTLDQVKEDGNLTLYSLKLQRYEEVKPEDTIRIL